MAECKALPTVLSWTPRTTRNAMHFREETLSPLQVFYQLSLLMISLEYLSRLNLQDRSGSLDIDKPRAWGFLYGACNGNRGLCGARGALLFSEGHHITFQAGLDRGMAEMRALAALFRITVEWDISPLWVFGDSTLVIGWVSRNYGLQNLTLQTCYDQIHLMLAGSPLLLSSFNYIFKEHNMLTDGLSKQALKVGSKNLIDTREGESLPTVARSIYEFSIFIPWEIGSYFDMVFLSRR